MADAGAKPNTQTKFSLTQMVLSLHTIYQIYFWYQNNKLPSMYYNRYMIQNSGNNTNNKSFKYGHIIWYFIHGPTTFIGWILYDTHKMPSIWMNERGRSRNKEQKQVWNE